MPVMPALPAHSHQFGTANLMAEKNTLRATVITLVMMVVEITGGYWLNSMALLADGWHMSPHTFAIGVSAALAYAAARTIRASLSAPGKSRSSEASPAPSSCSAWQ